MKSVDFYKRCLPHIHPRDAYLFITFRLADTVPKKVLDQLELERQNGLKKISIRNQLYSEDKIRAIEKLYFKGYDEWLNRCRNKRLWLQMPEIAAVVENALQKFDSIRYLLICYCIMPNHVHLLIRCFKES